MCPIKKDKFTFPWELFLFFALYLFLPNYFAFELHPSLPLLTGSRLVLVVCMIAVIFRKKADLLPPWKRLRSWNLLLTEDRLLRIGLIGYFVLLIAVNCTFLTSVPNEALKKLLSICLEEYLLVWFLCLLLDTRAKLVSALKVLAVGSGICAFFACLSVILNYNVFHLLDTTGGQELLKPAYRYGMLRAAGNLSHPVYYGAFCCVLLPLQMYLVDHTQSKKERKLYAVCTAFTFAALILANSRGSQLAFVLVAGLIFLIRLCQKRLVKLLRTYLPIILIAVLIVGMVVLLCPVGRYYISRTWNDLMSSFGASSDVGPGVDTPDTPDLPADTPDTSFGENVNGIQSRLVQLTGITFTLERSPLVGLGPNAHARGLLAYKYIPTKWSYIRTVDVNIVSIVSQFGLIGLLAFVSLLGSLGVGYLRKKQLKDPLMPYLLYSFLCYILCCFSVSSLPGALWILIGISVAMTNILRNEQVAA